jgi:hypothetical protein
MFKFMFLFPGWAIDLTFFQSVAQDTLVQGFVSYCLLYCAVRLRS